jgi:RNA recognition motif. (a.k.a. RRM, RBD, or RNP domain)
MVGSPLGACWVHVLLMIAVPGVAGRLDDEYKSFMAELGGGPPPSGPSNPSGRQSGFSSGPSGGGQGPSGGGGGGHFGGPGLGFDDGRGFRGGPRPRPGDDLPDDCKLYIGNLSPIITDEVLRGMMEPFGNVLHAVVLLDMPSGTSRGFGFVHMDKAESAGGCWVLTSYCSPALRPNKACPQIVCRVSFSFPFPC